jgi:hypothetical protein
MPEEQLFILLWLRQRTESNQQKTLICLFLQHTAVIKKGNNFIVQLNRRWIMRRDTILRMKINKWILIKSNIF